MRSVFIEPLDVLVNRRPKLTPYRRPILTPLDEAI